MKRTTITLLAIVLVATVAAPLGTASVGSSGVQDGTDDAEPTAANESIAPGERFAGVVGVQKAEIDGDVSERAYGVRIDNAETDAAKAAVIDEQYRESETRLAELEARLEELNESREAGELGEGRYRAEVATVVAEMRTVERKAEAIEATAEEVPEQVLADRGVDVESIRALRERAGERGGPETAAIARSIAGENADESSADRGAGSSTDGAENRSDGSDSSTAE